MAAAIILGLVIGIVGAAIVYWLREISEALLLIRMTVENMIKADMDHAEPECARCGAECTNPVCQEAVRNRR